MRRSLSARHRNRGYPHGRHIIPYAPLRYGENGDRSASFPVYFTTSLPPCQVLFFIFFKISFSRLLFSSQGDFFSGTYDTVNDMIFPDFPGGFLSNCLAFSANCIVLHEIFSGKSSILDIYFFPRRRYNNIAVGGTNTTASRTTVTRSLRSINLMISTRKRVHGCAFFTPIRGTRASANRRVPSLFFGTNPEKIAKILNKL